MISCCLCSAAVQPTLNGSQKDQTSWLRMIDCVWVRDCHATGRGPCRNCHGMHGSGMYNCCCALPVYMIFSQECHGISTRYFLVYFFFFFFVFAEYHCTRLYCNMYIQNRIPEPLPSACSQPKTLLTQCPFCSNHGTSARGKELSQLSQLPLISSSSSCFSSISNQRSLDWLWCGRAYFTRRLSQLKGTEYSQQATAPVVSSAASQRDSGRHRRVIKEHTLDKESARLFIAGTNETRGKRIYKLQRQHGPRTWASPAGPCQALCAWLITD